MTDLADQVAHQNISGAGDDTRVKDLRVLEALLFASDVPLTPADLEPHLSAGAQVAELIGELASRYSNAGVHLVSRNDAWAFRTAPDLAYLLRRNETEQRNLSRAALETLAIIAYHQPVTRAEMEDVRGVATSKGVLDVLLETGWIRMRGRRRTPGRPVTYGTTDGFVDHFGLESLNDLPGLDELKGAGLLSGNLPADFLVPVPGSGDAADEEDPLDPGDMGQESGQESDQESDQERGEEPGEKLSASDQIPVDPDGRS
ncbi:MAG: SMC-Scp complex subunit ScpB [Alphaproteobacteria bacterium]|nr:SMC-Scp complex subunit ScpB [Alphaproteobacteria bacterium]